MKCATSAPLVSKLIQMWRSSNPNLISSCLYSLGVTTLRKHSVDPSVDNVECRALSLPFVDNEILAESTPRGPLSAVRSKLQSDSSALLLVPEVGLDASSQDHNVLRQKRTKPTQEDNDLMFSFVGRGETRQTM